jgi:deoxyribonuclease V
MPKDEDGAYTDIIIKEKVYGRVLRTHTRVKPIFIMWKLDFT